MKEFNNFWILSKIIDEEKLSSETIIQDKIKMYFYSIFSQGYQESAMTFEKHEHRDKILRIKVAS